MDVSKLSVPKYSMKSPLRQRFPFRYTLISYLLETESPQILLKLQQSCKYFFAKKSILVVDEVVTCSCKNPIHKFPSGQVFADNRGRKYIFEKSKQYWFTSTFCSVARNLFRPHIYRLTLSKLSIFGENLSMTDIDFLLSNNQMKTLNLWRVNIRDANGNPVPIHYILQKVPNVIDFCYYNLSASFSTDILKSLKFQNKLQRFGMFFSPESEETFTKDLFKFIRKFAAPLSTFYIYFKSGTPGFEACKTMLLSFVNKSFARIDKPMITMKEGD